MKRVFLSTVAMCLLASSGVAIALGGSTFQRTAIAQDPSSAEAKAALPESEPVIDVEELQTEEVSITKIYSHELEGRSAATVYVRNIPVATFYGNDAESKETNTDDGTESLDAAAPETLDSATAAATQFAETVDRLNAQSVGGEEIGVKWDKDSKQYVVYIGDDNLIALTDGVTLPKTTKDKAEDALQITNRLRRQLSQAAPLKEIEGRPRPVVVKKPEPQTVAAVRSTLYQEGWASWYGPGFHGNLTASGGRFNQYAMTAAHRYLPFGSRVRVTNLDSGRSVVVTINDRGPFIHNRVIDLSRGAAQAIGVISSGVAPVRLDLIQ